MTSIYWSSTWKWSGKGYTYHPHLERIFGSAIESGTGVRAERVYGAGSESWGRLWRPRLPANTGVPRNRRWGCFSPIILAFFRSRQQFPPPLRLFFTRNSCIPTKPETISCFSRRHFKTGQAGSTSRNSESTSPEFTLKKAEMKK